MRVTRTLSEGVVTYGDTVTVSSRLVRLGVINGNLARWMRDYTPECFQLVDPATNDDAVTWTPSNGTTYSNGSEPSEVTLRDSYVEVRPSGLGHEPPVTMTTRYVVTCDAGTVQSGGFRFSGTVRDGDFRSMGPAITVQRKGTSTSLDQPASVVIGQPTPLRASTDAPAGTAIEFLIDGEAVSSVPANSEGVANYDWTAPTPGQYQIAARAVQTNTHASSTSQTVNAEVVRSESSLAISAAGPVMAGSSVPLTATTDGIAEGQPVEFLVNGQPLGTADVAGDSATYTEWSPATAGDYTIQARYAGSTNVAGSQSQQVGVTVIDPVQQTTTNLDVDPEPVPGQASTLTANVTDGNDGDTVTFINNGMELGTATLEDGVARFDWTPTAGQAAQPYSVTAAYVGSPGYASSTSAAVTGAIGLVQTEVSVVDAAATATVGEQVTLSATVTGGTPGQTIEFRDGDTVLETVRLSSGGNATAYWTPEETGEFNVTAHYPGTDTTRTTSSPSATAVSVAARESSLELSGPHSVSVGQDTTLTVTTNGIGDGQAISFEVDGTEIDTATVTDDQARIQWAPEATGNYQIRAVYAGSATVTGSQSNVLDVVVGLSETQTATVTASADPVTGEPVTLSTTVTGGTEGVTVEFRNAGDEVLCSGPLGADGTIDCAWTPDTVGDVSVTAHYLGDATTSASQSPGATTVQVGQGVVAAPSELVVTPATPTAADSVTVSGQAPVGALVSVFTDEGQECTVIAGADGTFSCELGTLPVGQNNVRAIAELNGEASQITTTSVTVGMATSSVTVTGPASVQPGQEAPLELTTTGIADGETVDILVNDESVGTATVTDGEATFPWTPTEAGEFVIRADYAGSDTVEPAQSAELTITVNETASQTSNVTASAATINEPVTLSATVTNGTEGVDVEFRDGDTVLCTGTVAADGSVDCEWTPTAAGTVNVTAHYLGDGATSSSQSPRATTVAVSRTASTVGLGAPSSVEVGDDVQFTVTATGIADGQAVDITVDGTVIGSPTVTGGQAEFTWTAPATAGTVTATAAYAGNDTVAASESDPVTIEVTPVPVPDAPTGISIAPESVTVGDQVTVTGQAEAGSTVSVMVDGVEVCSVEATDGTFTCEFTATEGMDGQQVTVTATDAAGNTSDAADGGTLDVQPVVIDPTEPSITVTPAQPVAGEPVQITVTGDAGEDYVITADGAEVCQGTLDEDGAATCEWTPAEEGQIVLQVTVGEQTVEETVTVAEAPDTEAPAAPTGITVSPQPATVGETVTVTGSAEADSTVSVKVDGVEICEVTATDGTFTCAFTATEEMDGQQVTVTATDEAGNTSTAADGRALEVQPEAVDPTEPTITLTPAQPVAGEKVEIEITGDAGEEVVIVSGERELCRVTLDQDGTATCEWTPDADGQTVLVVTVGDQTVEKTVTVRPADDDGDDGDDNDDGAGSGSLDMGSLGSLTGGAGGASGSSGSLASLGS